MTMFECKRCGKTCKNKFILQCHLSRKNPCSPEKSNIEPSVLLQELEPIYNETVHSCPLCAKKFNSKSSMYRHKKICEKKNSSETEPPPQCKEIVSVESIENLTRYCQTLENAVNTLLQKMEKLEERKETTINNNVTNYIILNNFGEERITHLDDNIILDCFEEQDPTLLIENIHFNADVPENKNIRVVDDNTMEVFKNGDWISQDADSTITELIKRGWRILRFGCNTMKTKVLSEQKMTLEYYEKIHNWWDSLCQNEDMQEPYKQEILMLCKNGNIYISHRPITSS